MTDPINNTSDHFCAPCDVTTMAARLDITPTRLQQIAKDDPGCKSGRGEYICPRVLRRYIGTIKDSKRKNASGLVKKQEESLDIRNARDRAEVLAEWEIMVQRQAVTDELAPIFLSVRNGMRAMANTLPQDIKVLVQEYAEKKINGQEVRDYEIEIAARKMVLEKVNENLTTFSKGIAAYAEERQAEDAGAGGVARRAGKFWAFVKNKFT